jgi:hypothetical protein
LVLKVYELFCFIKKFFKFFPRTFNDTFDYEIRSIKTCTEENNHCSNGNWSDGNLECDPPESRTIETAEEAEECNCEPDKFQVLLNKVDNLFHDDN